MRDARLAVAALVFGLLALGAGSSQLAAYLASAQPRHAVLAIFALSVGVSVVTAVVVALWRHRRR